MEQLLSTWAVREVVRPVLDVLMLAYLLYKSWQILVQTRAVQLIKGTVLMVVIYAVSFFLQLRRRAVTLGKRQPRSSGTTKRWTWRRFTVHVRIS